MQRSALLFSIIFLIINGSCKSQPAFEASKNESNQNQQREIQTIIHIAENYICNPAWIESEAWNSFKNEIQSEEVRRLSTLEFIQVFNQKKRSLPFSHIHLTPTQIKKKQENKVLPFELSEIDSVTALLTIRSFVSDAAGMVKLVQKIGQGAYDNLIIDLRNNTGGTLDAAVVLGRFLTRDAIDAGVYLSRKWFLEKGGYPNQEEIRQLPFLKDMSFDGFGKMLDEHGAFRMVLPPHSNPVFEGKVYVLTNGVTGSTCEPLVDRLKKTGRATIVGQKTAGGMLSGRYFKINSEMKLFLPVADYITAEGARIDKVGVEPDIKVKSEEALNYVVELLNEGQ